MPLPNTCFHIPRARRAAAGLTAALALVAHGAVAQISDDVVRIGLLTDMSGLFSDITGRGSVVAAQMAIEDFGGQVRGKKIELLFADHQNKADIAANKAREWFDQHQLEMMADVTARRRPLPYWRWRGRKTASPCSQARAPSA